MKKYWPVFRLATGNYWDMAHYAALCVYESTVHRVQWANAFVCSENLLALHTCWTYDNDDED